MVHHSCFIDKAHVVGTKNRSRHLARLALFFRLARWHLQCHRARRYKEHRSNQPPTSRSKGQAFQPPQLGTMLPVEKNTVDNACSFTHYSHTCGRWSRDNILPHPTVLVTVSTDCSSGQVQSPQYIGKNITALADSGAQANIWSLREF